MSQIAKLFIRGKLIKNIARNLTQEQKDQVANLIDKVVKDPEIQNGLHEFAFALQRTIKNEYANNKDACFQEALITFWRTSVDILFGKHSTDQNAWGTDRIVNCPSPLCQCMKNKPLCRKKIFQTWMYNYLKQIIRENSRESTTTKTKINGEVGVVICQVIQSMLTNYNITPEIKSENNKYTISANKIPNKLKGKLISLNYKYANNGILITTLNNTIEVEHKSVTIVEAEITRKENTKIISITQKNDENDNEQVDPIQFKCRRSYNMYKDILSTDFIRILSSRLDEKTKKVFNVIVSPSNEYSDKHNGQLHKKHIADYLGITKNDVTEAFDNIRNEVISLGHEPASY